MKTLVALAFLLALVLPAAPQSTDSAKPVSFLSAITVIKDDYAADSGLTVDRSGNIYVFGNTNSSLLPTTSASYQQNFGGSDYCNEDGCDIGDGFIVKLDPTGRHVLAATYLGGVHGDSVNSIAFDSAGDLIVVAYTSTLVIPTTGGAALPKAHEYILKFDSGLTHLLAAIAWPNVSASVQVDSHDRIYVTGGGDPGEFKPLAPEHVVSGGPCFREFPCSYIAQLDANMSRVEAATWFPAELQAFAFASDGGYWVAGRAYPDGFPMLDTRPVRRNRGNSNVEQYFLAHFDKDLNLTSSVMAVPELVDLPANALKPYVRARILTADGTLVLAGDATQGVPVTPNALLAQPYPGQGTAFMIVIQPDGQRKYSSWLGPPAGYAEEIAVAPDGIIWIGGKVDELVDGDYTDSKWFAAIDPSKSGTESIVNYMSAAPDLFGEENYDGQTQDSLLLLPDGSLATALYGSNVTPDDSGNPGGLMFYRIPTNAPSTLTLTANIPTVIKKFSSATWQISVTNQGDQPALASQFRFSFFHSSPGIYDPPQAQAPLGDIFPLTSLSATQGSCQNGDIVTCSLGEIPPHATATITLQGLSRTFEPYFSDVLASQVSWQDASGTEYYDWETDPRPFEAPEIVALSMAVTGFQPTADLGSTAHYSITVTNSGPDVANNLVVDVFNGKADPSATNAYSCSGYQCNVTQLGVNQSVTVPISTTFNNIGSTQISLYADAPGNTTSLASSFTTTVNVQGPPADPPVLSSYTITHEYSDAPPLLTLPVINRTGYYTVRVDGAPHTLNLEYGWVAIDLEPAYAALAATITVQVCVPDGRCSNALTIPTFGYNRPASSSRLGGDTPPAGGDSGDDGLGNAIPGGRPPSSSPTTPPAVAPPRSLRLTADDPGAGRPGIRPK